MFIAQSVPQLLNRYTAVTIQSKKFKMQKRFSAHPAAIRAILIIMPKKVAKEAKATHKRMTALAA